MTLASATGNQSPATPGAGDLEHDQLGRYPRTQAGFFYSRPRAFLLTRIADCDSVIADCDVPPDRNKMAGSTEAMKLGEKIKYLREVEGSLRGLDRPMNQQELVRAIEAETSSKLSQSYLSQIESGARPHLTNTSRQVLAAFFKVHPGYLVDDPEGYHSELQSEVRSFEDKLDLWLVSGAERFRRDPELKKALLRLAQHEHSRECLLLLEAILDTPGLTPRLAELLRPKLEATKHEMPKKTAVRKQGTQR
jgi:transcriptional regulator with XRE-family HTH domain